jgi:Lhr-like helicase
MNITQEQPSEKSITELPVKEEIKEIISPIVEVTQIYKDVEISEESEKFLVDSKLEGAETARVSKTIKWSSILDITETTKRDQDLMEVKQLYKLCLNTGTIYCHIKDIKEFRNSWEQAIFTYDLI